MEKFAKGDKVRFRVPGLERIEGKSTGIVDGRVVEHDELEHVVKVTCPLGDEYSIFERNIITGEPT